MSKPIQNSIISNSIIKNYENQTIGSTFTDTSTKPHSPLIKKIFDPKISYRRKLLKKKLCRTLEIPLNPPKTSVGAIAPALIELPRLSSRINSSPDPRGGQLGRGHIAT